MPGGDEGDAQSVGFLTQDFKFDLRVAEDAGIGGAPHPDRRCKWFDHHAVEEFMATHHMQRYFEIVGRTSGGFDRCPDGEGKTR